MKAVVMSGVNFLLSLTLIFSAFARYTLPSSDRVLRLLIMKSHVSLSLDLFRA